MGDGSTLFGAGHGDSTASNGGAGSRDRDPALPYHTSEGNTMPYSTGNKNRDALLQRVITTLLKERTPISFDSVAAVLPNDFDLDLEELAGMLEAFAVPLSALAEPDRPREVSFEDEPRDPIPHDLVSGRAIKPPASKSLNNIEPPHANAPAPSGDSAANSTPQPKKITHAEALAAVNAAQNEIAEARIVVRQRVAELQDARGRALTAIIAWQSGGPKYTPEQNARDHINAQTAERARRIAAGGPTTSRTAAAYVRKRMVNQGEHRGAYPASYQHRIIPKA